MASDNLKNLRLYQDYWSEGGMTDENNLSNALLTQPDVLSPVLTHLAGREDKRFPLSFLTEGMGVTKELNDTQYQFPVIGRLNKAVLCTDIAGTGYGFSTLKITFKDRWFNKFYIVENPDGTQIRLQDEGVQVEKGWQYTGIIMGPDFDAKVTNNDTIGKMFVQTFAPVAISGSSGTTSNWVSPSKVSNQTTMIRKGYQYEGNAPNKVVNVEFDLGGRKSKLWWDFEEYQHFLRWQEEVEYNLWYSKYNRDSNGVIHNMDSNGKPIPIGAGAIQQIPNKNQYTFMTASKMKNIIRDIFYGASDAQKVQIDLFTGLGGLDEWDTAMKSEIASGTYIKNTPANAFISGTGSNLRLGGYFTSYQHIDGHIITVRHLPLFDHGAKVLNSPKHPKTGLPLESYKMIFLDRSTYDGEPNVYMVHQKGRQLLRWAVAGATIPPGFSGNSLRATDIDGASVHFMKSAGVAIRRATNCLYLECVRQ